MGFTPVMSYLTKWSPLERNTRLVLPEGFFLANRLLWLGASLGLLAFTYFRFQLVLPETRPKQKPGKQLPVLPAREQLKWGAGEALPRSGDRMAWPRS
ncbi:hypothetical protein [Hymenobacter volaticus]|uniref:Uncharacterized protein n=1 Tax=Hymenobacter volaticus TaxID=2932254 RepID=A0ABY4GFB4_9BACT|nr:hypothetical protein [Hymenobacter volaticus]UOQ69412.1 hypothetical protein MUN86_27395 [Hymenobacter volaticus]